MDDKWENFLLILSPDSYTKAIKTFIPNQSKKEMLQFLWQLKEFKSQKLDLVSNAKDSAKSTNYRTKANCSWLESDMIEAIKCCNKSLMYAENSEGLARAFAQRANFLLDAYQFRRAALDIQRASSAGHHALRIESLARLRIKCIGNLHKDETRVVMNSMRRSNTTGSQDKRLPPCCDKTGTQMSKQSLLRIFNRDFLSIPHHEPNPNAPALSNSVQIGFWRDKGRGIFAKRDIKPGEIIAVDKSYVFVPIESSILCSTCGVSTFNPLPCPNCSTVVFCSQECRTEGLSSYHLLECRILASLLEKGYVNAISVVRILGKHFFHEIKDLFMLYEEEARTKNRNQIGFNEYGQYISNLRSIYHLSSHLEAFNYLDVMKKCYETLLLFKLITSETDYLGERKTFSHDEELPEDALALALIIFRLTLVYHNGYLSRYPGKTSSFLMCGTGPLFNHSCNANSFYMEYGDTLVFRALEPIWAGNEIFSDYFGNYLIGAPFMSRKKRRRYLKDIHGFICYCPVCFEDWTLATYMHPFQIICNRCANIVDRKYGCMRCGLKEFLAPKKLVPNIKSLVSADRLYSLYDENISKILKRGIEITLDAAKLTHLEDIIEVFCNTTLPNGHCKRMQLLLINNYHFRSYHYHNLKA